jgi:hypothetical protein
MRRLLYCFRLIDLAWTIYYDGETALRTVWWLDGHPWVFGICAPPLFWDVTKYGGALQKDGSIRAASGNSYLREWVPFSAGRPKKPNYDGPHAWISPFGVSSVNGK